MLHPSTKKLIDRLCEMTAQRKIDWTHGEQPESLVYDTEGYRVLLEGDPTSLVLCDALGRELERADASTLATTNHADGSTYDVLLASMREDAARIARGTEDAIETVLGELAREDDAQETAIEAADEIIDSDLSSDEITPETLEDTANETDVALAADSEIDFAEDLVKTDTEDETSAVSEDSSEEFQAADHEADTQTGEDLGTDTFDAAVEPETTLETHELATDAETETPDTSPVSEDETTNLNSETDDALSEPAQTRAELEDTPDVGKAVADLAKQVQQTETPAAPQSNGLSTLMGGPAMLGLGSASALGTIKTDDASSAAQAVTDENNPPVSITEESISERVPLETLITSGTYTPDDLPETEDSTVLQPGETILLSGLKKNETADDTTEDAVKNTPVAPQTFRAATIVAEPAPDAISTSSSVSSDDAPDAPPPPVSTEPLDDTNEAEDAPPLERNITDDASDAASLEADTNDDTNASTEDKTSAETSKRFNPWL